MEGQQRRSIGDRIADRLMKRVARRARVGLSSDFLSRFGIADPWADLLGTPGEDDGTGGMVFLSGKPYRDRLRRLAWMRQHREERLASFSNRFRMERGPRALTRMAAFDEAGASRLRALSGLMPVSAGDMHLPPAPPVKVVEAEAPAEVAQPGRRSRGPGARVSSSPWLIRPFRPARVIRGQRSEPNGSTPVARAPSVAAWPTSTPTARHAVAASPTASPAHARRVAALRLEASRSAASPIVRFVEEEAPVLRRSAGGRRVLRELIEIAHLDDAEQLVRIRKVLARAGSRRIVVDSVEASAADLRPVGSASPAQRAMGRVDSVAGKTRSAGLRPVMAGSPSMRAVAPAPVARVEADLVVPERPVERAARRSRPSLSASLFQSPVQRSNVAPPAAYRSPMARARIAGVSSARRAGAAPRATGSTAAAAPLPALVRPRADGGAAPSPRPSRSAGSRRSYDGPGIEGAQPGSDLSGDSGLSARPLQRRVAPMDEGTDWLEPAPARTRSSARAVERFALMDAEVEATTEAPTERWMAGESLPARFQLSRSPRGAFVPAISLARPEPTRTEPSSTAELPPAAPRRERSAPTPALRASYVSPTASTARVATRPPARRASSTKVAEQRISGSRERSGSLLPRMVSSADSPQRAEVQPPALRRSAVVRLASGAYVARGTVSPNAVDPIDEGSDETQAVARRRADAPTVSPRRPSTGLANVDTVVARGARLEPLASMAGAEDGAPRSTRSARSTETRARAAHEAPRSPVVAAHERSLRAPLTGASARRVVAMAAGSVAWVDGVRTTVARTRPNPLAYAARFGLRDASSVRIEEWDGPTPGSTTSAGPSLGGPASIRSIPSRSGRSALDALDLRALSTAAWGDDPAQAASFSRLASPGSMVERSLTTASPGSVLRPLPSRVAAEAAPAPAEESRTPGWRRAGARGARVQPGPSAVASSQWAEGRSARLTARSPGSVRPARSDRGGFDLLGVYRPPVGGAPAGVPAAARSWGPGPAADAPAQSVLRSARGPGASAPVGGAGLQPGLPGAPATSAAGGRPVRPDLGVTLGAVDKGLANKVMPTWAQRANGEPLIKGEGQFIEALARASEPEEILRVIYQRAARGGMTTASTGLPAPIIQVIEQIRTVAGSVDSGASASVRGGPGSDAEVVRRSGVRREAPRSTARVAGGMTALRTRGSATRRDGVGADGISKLSKKLQQLILLAEQQRQAARKEVRMAEDSASARSEGHAAPTSGEGGNDNQVDIEALGREVLEVVSQELEMRRVRSQEGSDEYGWW